MNTDLVAYYAARASEYDALYTRQECRQDHRRMAGILQDVFRGQSVLEVACGTGYWTEQIAQTAGAVLASDINPAMLELAAKRNYPDKRVQFLRDDFYQSTVSGLFDGVYGGFIWSHIPLERLDDFVGSLISRIRPQGALVFADNLYVPGHSTPISGRDAAGNTFQMRRLADDSRHLVLKNFPEELFLREKLSGHGLEVAWVRFQFYWMAVCKRVHAQSAGARC